MDKSNQIDVFGALFGIFYENDPRYDNLKGELIFKLSRRLKKRGKQYEITQERGKDLIELGAETAIITTNKALTYRDELSKDFLKENFLEMVKDICSIWRNLFQENAIYRAGLILYCRLAIKDIGNKNILNKYLNFKLEGELKLADIKLNYTQKIDSRDYNINLRLVDINKGSIGIELDINYTSMDGISDNQIDELFNVIMQYKQNNLPLVLNL